MGRIRGTTIEATVVELKPVREMVLRTGEVEFCGENRRVWTKPYADRGFVRRYRCRMREAPT